jgi:phosphonate transport system ATP-binding protein
MSEARPVTCPDGGDPAIVLEHITKQYSVKAGVFDVSFRVARGEFAVLLGPSGAGKSTLFRCITGLVHPDVGRVEVLGVEMSGLRGAPLRKARRAIGLIFQQFNLINRVSAISNVLAGRMGHVSTPRVLLRHFSAEDRQRALAALDRVGLLEKAYQRADSLSGGQQQRVAIARVLAQESQVVLADEPVSSLDPDSAHNVLTILRDIARERGIAILCSLHQVVFAREYADRIIGVREGQICVDVPARTFGDGEMAAIYGDLVAARAARSRGR